MFFYEPSAGGVAKFINRETAYKNAATKLLILFSCFQILFFFFLCVLAEVAMTVGGMQHKTPKYSQKLFVEDFQTLRQNLKH